jgi:hypothetical protein
MHQVSGDNRFLPPRPDTNTVMARRVARSGFEPHLIGQLVVALDEFGESSVEYRA